MCYHSKQTKGISEVETRFKAKVEKPELFKRNEAINGFTHPSTPIITNKSQELIKEYNWGLIPHWSKDDKIKAFTLNARLDTIKEKASFKYALNNRCLIIADGFYEWQWLNKGGTQKQKYLLTEKNDNLFSFAGLYNDWVNKETGELFQTYTIVTTDANPLMAEIHNNKKRMPITLTPEREKQWLEGLEINEFKLDAIELIAHPI